VNTHIHPTQWLEVFIAGCLVAGCSALTGGPASRQADATATARAQANSATAVATEAGPSTEPAFSGSGPWPITFTTDDNVELSGTLYGIGPVSIVLAPTYPGGQDGWADFARAAADKGYRALTFDFRGYGSSKGSQDAATLPTDIQAAVSYLQSQHGQPIILAGAGFGGSAAIAAAAKDPSISGIALISALHTVDGLHLDDSDLSSLKMPSLWLAARNDLTQNVEDMYALAGSSQKELWIYEGSSLHGTYIFDGADGPDLQRRLLEFVAGIGP
jgi:alpha/beta superfamily hydrolase